MFSKVVLTTYPKKIAVFGGTFSPFHMGHFSVCQAVQKALKPDIFYLIPNHSPPHKPQPLFTNTQRLEIISLNLFSLPFITLNLFEIKNQETSLSYKTAQYLRKKHPNDSIFWVLGSDSLLDLHLWEGSEWILTEFNLFHVKREGFNLNRLNLENSILNLSQLQSKNKIKGGFFHSNIRVKKVSSTQINHQLKVKSHTLHKSIKQYTHPNTHHYLNLWQKKSFLQKT